MMLHMLSAREQGLDPPWLFPAIYCSQRFASVELSREKELDRAHRKGVNSLDVDREGRYLISGGADKYGTVAIHDLHKPPGTTHYKCPVVSSTMSDTQSGRRRPVPQSEEESHAVSVVQWYPHDTGIFTTSSVDNKLKIWDTNELCVVEKFAFSQPIYTHSTAAATSHCLIAVGGRESKVTLCDMHSGSATHVLRSHRKPVMALAWSPREDHLLASGSQDNKILMWDIRRASGPLLSLDQHNGSGSSNLASVVTAHNGYVNGLMFTSDGLFLVSFGTDNQLRLWDAFSGKNTLVNYGKLWNSLPKQTCQFAISPHTSTLHPVLCLPSGGDLVMLEMFTGKKLRKLQGHFGSISCLTVHPYEQELYSGGSDTNILAWGPPPPPPRAPQNAATSSLRVDTRPLAGGARATSYYQDSWSDEDDS